MLRAKKKFYTSLAYKKVERKKTVNATDFIYFFNDQTDVFFIFEFL